MQLLVGGKEIIILTITLYKVVSTVTMVFIPNIFFGMLNIREIYKIYIYMNLYIWLKNQSMHLKRENIN